MQKTVNRNAPCPCGSGKKHKHCCGRPRPADPQVLYVHPAKQGVDFYTQQQGSQDSAMGRPYGVIPLGVPALINRLVEAGVRVNGINYPLEKQLDSRFDLRAWLRAQRSARVVLIDLHWYEHSYGAISVAEVVEEALPEARTVLGGLTASGFAGEILRDFPAVDFVIRGDAEAPLSKLVQAVLAGKEAPVLPEVPNLVYRDGDAVCENSLGYCAVAEDLDALNYADLAFLEHRDAYYVHEYIVTDLEAARRVVDKSPFRGKWICTARGCKYECSYCGGCKSAHKRLAGRGGIVPRSPEAVVEELGRLAADRVIQASLSYDIAEMGNAYWRKLFSLLRKQGTSIGLYNEFFQLPPQGFVKDFARSVDMAHSCLALSPLSGSERVRRLNGKHYDNAALFNTLDYLNLYNVPIFVYFSLNLPGENEETIHETVALARHICAMYPLSLLKILNTCHTVDPFCPMNLHPEKYGITVSYRTFRDYYDYCRETQLAGPGARAGDRRGFESLPASSRSLAAMADVWDAARQGYESCWWPIPPSW